jgi:hypothetical protein
MYYQELKTLLKEFPDEFRGIITADMLVKNAPMQFKTATLNAIQQSVEQRQQQQQLAMQQAKADQQLQQAVTGLQVAQGIESIADAEEKRSEIPLNRAKTISEINKNQASPLIDLIKEQVKLEIAREKQAQTAGNGAVNGG